MHFSSSPANICFILCTLCCIQTELFSQTPAIKPFDDPDIAAYRPRFKPEKPIDQASPIEKPKMRPVNDVSARVNAMLDTMYVRNKSFKTASGYRVMIYSGTDKTEVNNTKEKAYKILPDEDLYTEYKQPDYRIKVGDYIDELEAYATLVKLQKILPSAIIIQDQINIKRQ